MYLLLRRIWGTEKENDMDSQRNHIHLTGLEQYFYDTSVNWESYIPCAVGRVRFDQFLIQH